MTYNGMGLNLASVVTSMATLAATIAAIFLIARLIRPRLALAVNPSGRALKICETLALDPKRRVHLLECEGSRVLILVGGSQDQVLGWVQQK